MEDTALLHAALVGYQARLAQIDEAIAEVQNRLSGKAASSSTPRTGKRVVSPAARKRMAAAQRRRWAAYRKRKAGQS
jgi:hypothetical protein